MPIFCRLFLLLLTLSALPAFAEHNENTFGSSFLLRNGITFYVVNQSGNPFSIKADIAQEPVLVRVFDPQENLIFRAGFPDKKEDGSPQLLHERTFAIPASGSGVYQVVVTSFGGKIGFATVPELPFGVYGHPQWLVAGKGQYQRSFVYLPPRLPVLPVMAQGKFHSLIFRDAANVTQLELKGENPSGQVPLPAEEGTVWELSVDAPGGFALSFDGLPVILCPDATTARTIRASVDFMPDGTLCFHHAQVKAWQLLQEYRKLPESDFAVTPPDMKTITTELSKDLPRSRYLFGPYGVLQMLPVALGFQNLDPASPTFGMFSAQYAGNRPASPQSNPWTEYRREHNPQLVYQGTAPLTGMYDLAAPWNTIHKNPALLKRILISELQNVMMLRENERFDSASTEYFGGGWAFTLNDFTGTFPYISHDSPGREKAALTALVRRAVDRYAINQTMSASNQWAIGLNALVNIWEGTREDLYLNMLREHIRWLRERTFSGMGERKSGYLTEACGPDASYSGLAAAHLAEVYGRTKLPEVKEVLRDLYVFYNHSTVIDPTGEWKETTGFCHRTPWGWLGAQGGGGLMLMAGELPEAGVRVGKGWGFWKNPQDEKERIKEQKTFYANYSQATIEQMEKEGRRLSNALGWYRWYCLRPKEFLPGTLPAMNTDRFDYLPGDGFYYFRRPAYYTGVFADTPMCGHLKQTDPEAQWPRNNGLLLFWTPGFGVSLLSQNWCAQTNHTLIARSRDGKLHEVDYRSIKQSYNEATHCLTITGRMKELPVTFTRNMFFAEDTVEMELTINAEEEIQLAQFDEFFPYAPEKIFSQDNKRVPVLATITPAENQNQSSAVLFSAAGLTGGHQLRFVQPRSCAVENISCGDHYGGKHEYRAIKAGLPLTLPSKGAVTLRVSLSAYKESTAKLQVSPAAGYTLAD